MPCKKDIVNASFRLFYGFAQVCPAFRFHALFKPLSILTMLMD
ncbi:hypothetical protein B4100_3590 [Heyndrickxia coagulans]|nr:hypothetical protein B4100_3590 [Heyndrickxia coagulans]